MRYQWRDRIRNYAWVQRIGTLLLCLIVVAIFLPRERIFWLEYQLEQPWKHEKLLAPFDFGIRKSPVELEAETALVTQNQLPVFRISERITNEILVDFHDRCYAALAAEDSTCDDLIETSVELLSSLLQTGLIERQHERARDKLGSHSFRLYDNQQLIRQEFRQALSIQNIHDTFQVVCQRSDSLCSRIVMEALVTSLKPNAPYDDSLYTLLLESDLSAIVPTLGLVETERAIIDRGEMVTPETYRILESLKTEMAERTISGAEFRWSAAAQLGIVALLLILLMVFIHMNQRYLFNDPRPTTLALLLIAVSIAMSALALSGTSVSIYAIPIGITPLLLRMFYDFRVSIFTFIILVLCIALLVRDPLEFMVIQISAISFATLYQASSTRRSRMLGTALVVFLGYSLIYLLISVAQTGNLDHFDSAHFGWFAINGLLCTLVFPLIFVVEKVFGYLSETTLLELSESNQPLLRELAIKAPGTFQHSLQVANLCEKIAHRIGGNAVLLRTAAMYHDVGKMNEPQFFIENQLPDNNPHDDLEPDESAAIIIDHVYKGIELAKYHRLPMDLVQFIRTHHGTSKVRFFLKKAQERAELSGETLDEALFTYPGPRPNTKEQAILMMADSVEAASRSLKKYDHASLESLVDRLIDQQRMDGQYEDAPITFRDISDAKAVLKTALKGIFHQRISYD